MTEPDRAKNPHHNQIMVIYGLFIAAMLSQFIPSVPAQIIGMFIGLGVVTGIEIVRIRSEKESLLHNHMVFLSRTFWIGSLLVLLGVLVGAFFMMQHILQNPDQMQMISDEILAGVSDGPAMMNFSDQMIRVLIPCFAPGTVYMIWRVARGALRAVKGYRVANPRAFF